MHHTADAPILLWSPAYWCVHGSGRKRLQAASRRAAHTAKTIPIIPSPQDDAPSGSLGCRSWNLVPGVLGPGVTPVSMLPATPLEPSERPSPQAQAARESLHQVRGSRCRTMPPAALWNWNCFSCYARGCRASRRPLRCLLPSLDWCDVHSGAPGGGERGSTATASNTQHAGHALVWKRFTSAHTTPYLTVLRCDPRTNHTDRKSVV